MADPVELRDEDRLPWLETVEPDPEPRGGAGRTVALLLLGAAVLAAVLFGVWSWRSQRAAGDGTLIAAQEGDYKVRPDDPGGLRVEGEGEEAVKTSNGKPAGDGRVDPRGVPEAPIVTASRPAPRPSATPAPARTAVVSVPRSGGPLKAIEPMARARATVPGAGGGGSLVQLGAYPSEATANTAWGQFAKRFGYLAPLGKAVQAVEINGRTLYRLRVNAGSANQAADICGRLRVAGESCFVAS
jgi:hypothetical protein